jgi:hypothetical protein
MLQQMMAQAQMPPKAKKGKKVASKNAGAANGGATRPKSGKKKLGTS